MGEIINLSTARRARQLRGSTTKAILEARVDKLLAVLQDRHCADIIAEILVLRDAIWQLDADDAIHHRTHRLPEHLPRDHQPREF